LVKAHETHISSDIITLCSSLTSFFSVNYGCWHLLKNVTMEIAAELLLLCSFSLWLFAIF